MVLGHHDALQRALSNVLLNAVDACSTGGHISVAVDRSRLNGNEAVRIAVRDSGCGVPEGRIETIWEPYVTSKPGGAGLGLAITRQTILAHHGTVGAHSLPDGGTEILFVLPVQSSSSVDGPVTEIAKVIVPTSKIKPQSSPIGRTDFPVVTPISSDR